MIDFPETLDLFDLNENDENINRLRTLAAKYEIQRFAVRVQSVLQKSNNITRGCDVKKITILHYKSNNTINVKILVQANPKLDTDDVHWVKKQTKEYILEAVTENVRMFIKRKVSLSDFNNTSSDILEYNIIQEDISKWIVETIGEKNYSIMEAKHFNDSHKKSPINTDIKKL